MVPVYLVGVLLPVVSLLVALFIFSLLMCRDSSPHPPFPRSLGHQHPRFVAIIEALYQRSDDGAMGRLHMLTPYDHLDDYRRDHVATGLLWSDPLSMPGVSM